MKTSLATIDRKINRENAKEQGFFDGRFRNKVVPDKKKKNSKEAAKKWRLEQK